jgi:hypothetical protein
MLILDTAQDQYCQGITHTVQDAAALAQALAAVLAQEYSLARRLVTGGAPTQPRKLSRQDADHIIAKRIRLNDRYHRDGYLFQLIMWLAAQKDRQEHDLLALPHSQATAKGQDGFIVHRLGAAFHGATICEDKATERPRDTIREDVWPELKEYESGARNDELRSNIIATLGIGGVPLEEAEALIQAISWSSARRYRVRITTEEPRGLRLFEGFETIISGLQDRRRGETVMLPGLRAWMDQLAVAVETQLLALSA